MVLIKIFVAIILAMLQRYEIRANISKTDYYAAGSDCGECENENWPIWENFAWFEGTIQR